MVSLFLNFIVSPQMIILQGGEDVKKRTNQSLIKEVGDLSATKKILVIPWTSESVEKEMTYRHIFTSYFVDSGFKTVLFLEKGDSEAVVSEKFSSADVIYLPGGDTGVLYRELNLRSLQVKLRGFKGIIIGNSAGAILLSKGGKGDDKFYTGFDLVDFFITVHFKPEKETLSGTEMSPIINIPENMWVAVSMK